MSRSFIKLIVYWGLMLLLFVFHSNKIDAIVKPLNAGESNQGYVYQQPMERGDGWLTASLTDYHIDLSMIVAMMDKAENKDFGDIHGILIIKDGRLVLEEYFSGTDNLDGTLKNYDWDVLHYTASCSKSVTSVLTGIAFDRRFLTDMDEKLPSLFPEYSDINWTDGRQNIILEHLLTMRAGLYWNENPADQNNSHDPMNHSADPIKYVLQLPLINEPGTTWLYNSGLPILLGGIIKNRTDNFAHIFAEQHLFGPLCIQDYFWYLFPNGYPHTGGGLLLRPRDMAKIGQLYLQDGMWNGNRIISKNWIQKSIEPYTRLRFSNSNDEGGYGFLWWLRTINSNGKKYESYFALGYGGQYILVFEQLNMVVVFTANTHNSPGPMEMVKKYILPAMSDMAAQFTRIEKGEFVNDGASSIAVSWIDYDNDDDLDLFVTNTLSGVTGLNTLFENDGYANLTKIISSDPLLSDNESSRGCTWGDYDNDGNLDVFIANFSNSINSLYRNNGDGSFAKILNNDIANNVGDSFEGCWADYDNDGDLDLFVANEDGDVPPPMADENCLYRNDGWIFTRIIHGVIVSHRNASQSAVWCDYDNDGDSDIYVVNSLNQNNCLYINNGNGSFDIIEDQNIVTDGGESSSACWGDYDNDGDFDLFVANMARESDGPNFLYANNGDGTFSKITEGNIVNTLHNSSSCNWADYDNDGDLDLLVTGDDSILLYQNNGNGSFSHITDSVVGADQNRSRGAAWGDYDKDGDLDLYLANCSNQNNAFYKNNGNNNHWIEIKCTGKISNRSAIGTKVRLKATIYGNPVWQLREISSLSGKYSLNSLNAHFGLGDATIVDSVKIQWTSGLVEILTGIEVNQFLNITEGENTGIDNQYFKNNAPGKFGLFQNFPNPFNPCTTIQFSLPYPSPVSVKIYNTQGRLVRLILDQQFRSAGPHTFTWNGTDDIGNEVSSGVYILKMDMREFSEIKKMTLIK